MNVLSRVRGTQDFLDTRLLSGLLRAVDRVLKRHNFREISTPIIEQTALFKRSLGNVTDIVNKEMFLIDAPEDKDRGMLCLRPEATASIVRAAIEHGVHDRPWKVFLVGPMFRYERPQKGRFRQFHQVSIEVIGAEDVLHDVELIAMLHTLFVTELNLPSITLEINFLGTQDERKQFTEHLRSFLLDNSARLCATCVERINTNCLRVLDCKNESCQQQYVSAPRIVDVLGKQSQQEWRCIQDTLAMLSIPCVVNHRLVRGLDYYSKTVFEFSSSLLGAQSALCGGGRYDQLFTMLGAKKDEPSVGAAIGIERVLLLMEAARDQLHLPPESPLVVIAPLGVECEQVSLLLADQLWARNVTVEVLLGGSSFKSMLRKANKRGASTVLIIGEHEQRNGTVIVKQMRNGDEQVITQGAVAEFLTQKR